MHQEMLVSTGRIDSLPVSVWAMLLACVLVLVPPQLKGVPVAPLLSAAGGEHVAGRTHELTRLPLTAEGWTDLHTMVSVSGRYEDARVLYVSSSEGNDSTARIYQKNDVELAGNPFDPVGGLFPFSSIAAARARMRPGFPDIMLLKRGDEFEAGTGDIDPPSGRSNDERSIVASYGSSSVRPAVIFENRFGIFSTAAAHHKIIAGLSIASVNRSINAVGVLYRGHVTNVLLEDNYISGFSGNVVFQQYPSTAYLGDIALRRNVIVDAWDARSHSQGLFISGVEGTFLNEENIFDANGYRDGVTEATWFNRNFYLSTSPNVITRGVIHARSASGEQMRLGGVYERNLSLRNSWAIAFGHAENPEVRYTGMIRESVILDARPIGLEPFVGAQGPRAIGIDIGGDRMEDVLIEDVIVAHNENGYGPSGALVFGDNKTGRSSRVHVRGLIVYRWSNAHVVRFASSANLVEYVIEDSDFIHPGIGSLIDNHITSAQDVTWRNCRFHSADPTPFRVNGVDRSFANFQSVANTENCTHVLPSYPDPERTIETYMTYIGEGGGLAEFMARSREQSRLTWDERFTARAVINYIREGFGRPELD
jgi:hypothetical protein